MFSFEARQRWGWIPCITSQHKFSNAFLLFSPQKHLPVDFLPWKSGNKHIAKLQWNKQYLWKNVLSFWLLLKSRFLRQFASVPFLIPAHKCFSRTPWLCEIIWFGRALKRQCGVFSWHPLLKRFIQRRRSFSIRCHCFLTLSNFQNTSS